MVDEQLIGKYSNERQSPSFLKFSLADTIIVVFVACIGIFGSFYVFGSLDKEIKKTDDSALSVQLSNIDFKTLAVSSEATVRYDAQNHIQVKGKYVAGQFLQFYIPEYSAQGTYSIDFGNGDIRILDDQEFVYSYMSPGTFVIRLIVDYKDQKAVIQEKLIEIKPEEHTSSFITSL